MQPVLGLGPPRAVWTVDHVVGDLLAAVRGKAVQHHGIGVGVLEQLTVDPERNERPHPVQAVVLLAHRRPGVGHQHVGAVGRSKGYRGDVDLCTRVPAALFGSRDDVGVRLEPDRGRDRDVNSRGDAPDQQRLGHVVGAVSEVRQPEVVCRSASTWHGWNSSDSALITGTVAADAIAVSLSCPYVRQTIASTYRDNTRAVSSNVSSRPNWVLRPSTTTACPPSCAMPSSKENRVRVEFLSKITATPRGPSRGRRPNGSFFISAASSNTVACSADVRSSSRRKCLMSDSASCHAPALRATGSSRALSSTPGNAFRNSSICASVMINGGANRTTSGVAALTRNPASRAAVSTGLASGAVNATPHNRPLPRTWSTSG